MAFQRAAFGVGLAALFGLSCSNSGGLSTVNVSGSGVYATGQPYRAGQTVILSSGTFSVSLVTDANGAFSAQDVPTPYTAMVTDAYDYVVAYQGLTRADPTLTGLGAPFTNHRATLTGQSSGGSHPEASLNDTSFVFSSPDVVFDFLGETSGSFQTPISWSGAATTTGTLYAIQIQGYFEPTGYLGYGSRSNVTLEDNGTLSGQDVTLSPVTTATLSVTLISAVSLGAGMTVQLLVAPTVALNLTTFDPIQLDKQDVTFAAPSIPGTSLLVTAGGNGSFVQKAVAANASVLTLYQPADPALLLPADGATVTLSTPFSWTAYPSGVHLFQVSANGRTATLVTTATSAALSTFTAAGLTFSCPCTWTVVGLAPFASVDAVTGLGGTYPHFFGDLTQGQSPQQSFAFSP